MRLTEGTQPPFNQRRVGQHPAVHGAVVDLEATFEQQLLDIAVAEWVAQIPGHRLDDQPRLEVPAHEVVLRPALQLGSDGGQDHQATSEREAANSADVANEPLTPEFATRPTFRHSIFLTLILGGLVLVQQYIIPSIISNFRIFGCGSGADPEDVLGCDARQGVVEGEDGGAERAGRGPALLPQRPV